MKTRKEKESQLTLNQQSRCMRHSLWWYSLACSL